MDYKNPSSGYIKNTKSWRTDKTSAFAARINITQQVWLMSSFKRFILKQNLPGQQVIDFFSVIPLQVLGLIGLTTLGGGVEEEANKILMDVCALGLESVNWLPLRGDLPLLSHRKQMRPFPLPASHLSCQYTLTHGKTLRENLSIPVRGGLQSLFFKRAK